MASACAQAERERTSSAAARIGSWPKAPATPSILRSFALLTLLRTPLLGGLLLRGADLLDDPRDEAAAARSAPRPGVRPLVDDHAGAVGPEAGDGGVREGQDRRVAGEVDIEGD